MPRRQRSPLSQSLANNNVGKRTNYQASKPQQQQQQQQQQQPNECNPNEEEEAPSGSTAWVQGYTLTEAYDYYAPRAFHELDTISMRFLLAQWEMHVAEACDKRMPRDEAERFFSTFYANERENSARRIAARAVLMRQSLESSGDAMQTNSALPQYVQTRLPFATAMSALVISSSPFCQ